MEKVSVKNNNTASSVANNKPAIINKPKPNYFDLKKKIKKDEINLKKTQILYDQKAEKVSKGALKSSVLAIANLAFSLGGFSVILPAIQTLVNKKIIVNKINKSITKKLNYGDYCSYLLEQAKKMRAEHNMTNKVKIQWGDPGEAYYTHTDNSVVVGRDEASALFHEIGHADIENNTNVLGQLQRFRGNYAIVAGVLYSLTINPKSKENQKKINIFHKLKYF